MALAAISRRLVKMKRIPEDVISSLCHLADASPRQNATRPEPLEVALEVIAGPESCSDGYKACEIEKGTQVQFHANASTSEGHVVSANYT